MIVFHVAVTAAEDYQTRREAHRREHIARLQGFRATSILIGGGPAPDGKTADLFYRLQQPWQVKPAMEEDPYWTGGVWTGYTPRSFSHFVDPWELVPVVLDDRGHRSRSSRCAALASWRSAASSTARRRSRS